jgi:hypothetical protein
MRIKDVQIDIVLSERYDKLLKILGIKDRFVYNIIEQTHNNDTLYDKLDYLSDCEFFHDFIDEAFSWNHTPEKGDFWDNIARSGHIRNNNDEEDENDNNGNGENEN